MIHTPILSVLQQINNGAMNLWAAVLLDVGPVSDPLWKSLAFRDHSKSLVLVVLRP